LYYFFYPAETTANKVIGFRFLEFDGLKNHSLKERIAIQIRAMAGFLSLSSHLTPKPAQRRFCNTNIRCNILERYSVGEVWKFFNEKELHQTKKSPPFQAGILTKTEH